MLVTNNTAQDIYFGPLHLEAGVGQTLTVDDTSATSLYLQNDAVADALNNAYAANKIQVSGEAQPFPRPTGVPQLLHGDGDPEGLVYAPQGSVFMRRDNSGAGNALYVKTTGVTSDTGWQSANEAATVVATTVAGLGNPVGGSTGLIRAGASPYTEINVTYDSTKAHWVSPEFAVIAQGGTSFGVSAYNSTIVAYGVIDGYGDARTAGLNLELRAGFWMTSNQSNPYSSWAVGIKSQTGSAAYDTSFGNYTSLATGGTNSSSVLGYDTGWLSAAGPASNTRAVVAIMLSATNTGQSSTLYYPSVRARWIG